MDAIGFLAAMVGEEPIAGGGARRSGIAPVMRAAARILRPDAGPNIAAVEFSGWDTHANQGLAGGALDRLLGQLAEGLAGFRTEMGNAWADTTVVVMTAATVDPAAPVGPTTRRMPSFCWCRSRDGSTCQDPNPAQTPAMMRLSVGR